jgi:hypothetical protein
MGTFTTFRLTEAERQELEVMGELNINHHWQLWKHNGIYSCTYDGQYEEFYNNIEDLLVRDNEIEGYEKQ